MAGVVFFVFGYDVVGVLVVYEGFDGCDVFWVCCEGDVAG